MAMIPYNVRELESFRALMVEGSTTAAARRTGLSQPAISRTISQFEQKIGAKLFLRSGGRMTPTPEAIQLDEKLDQIFYALTDIEQAVFFPGVKQRLNVVTTSGIARALITDAVAEFMPLTPFRQSDLHCVVPKGHALSNVPIVQIKDLIDVPLIGFATDALNKRLIDNEFSRLGEVPNWIIQMRDNEIAIEFVSRGLGVTILTPFPFVERYLDMVEVVKFEMTYPRAIVFISNSDKPESDFARSFRSHLREFSQKYSYSYPVDR